MKLVAVSDTHLESPFKLNPVLIREMEKADLVIHCGDFKEDAVLRFFQERFPLEAVQGNRDSAGIRSQLPERKVIHIGGTKVGICHGWGSPFRLAAKIKARFDPADIIIFGHSHIPFHKKLNGTILFNPGTASGLALKLKKTYGRIIIDQEKILCEIVPVPPR